MLARAPVLRGPRAEHHLELLVGCATQRALRRRASSSSARARRPTRSTSSATAAWRSRSPRPARGAITFETLGRRATSLGWSWLFPPYRWHFDARARRADARHRARRQVPAREVRAGPRPRLRADDSASCRSSSSGCEATRLQLLDVYGSRAEAAMAQRSPHRRPDAARSPTACGASRRRRPTPSRWSSTPADGRRLRLRAGPVQHALRLRRRRGADLDQRRPGASRTPLVHTIRAVGTVTQRAAAAEAGRRDRRARPVRQRLAGRRGATATTS